MRHFVECAVRVLVLTILSSPLLAATVQPTGKSVEGEVVVKFHAGASREEVAGLARASEVSESEKITDLRTGSLWRMRSRSRNTEALVAALQRNPKVAYAEPNFIVEPVATPNDPRYAEMWALNGALAHISAEAAWNVTTGSKEIVVGVVDTGVNYRHPDLAANMWVNPGGKGNAACAAGTFGYNARTRTCDPMDDHYHGSHVAGTIGAAGNNGLGVTGINWNTSIMALKFLGGLGNASGTTADAIVAIDFAIQAKIDGVNVRVLCNSWGGGGFSKALLDIINKANEHDILFVAAAGNAGTDNDFGPHYPSSYQTLNMIAVAATDLYDDLAGFSNYGASSVHLGAPGVNILSTASGEGYVAISGTSMATPHVAGVAALVLAKTPSMTTAQLRTTLLESGDPIKSLNGKTSTGRRLNAARALGAPPLPNFSIAVGPSSQDIARGQTASFSVTIRPEHGFNGAVDLSLTGLPAGATATFNPASTRSVSTLTITTSATTPLGFSELAISGVSGTLRRTMWAGMSVGTEQTIAAACPRFTQSSRYEAGAATGVTVGDFNRDGESDFAAVAHDRNVVSVMIGHGNQTFRAPVTYAAGSAPMAVAAVDVNGDAKLDLVTANSGSTTISLLLGNGDGTFQTAVAHPVGNNPFAITSGDFNRDGRNDLAVGNNGSSSVTILLGNGDGTFAAPAHYPAASGPYSVAAADVDGDGDTDLAVAAYNAHRAAILLNNGNGTFAAPVTYTVGTNPSGVAFADFDGNGAPDLAVSNFGGPTLSVLIGNGDGTFRAPLQLAGDTETNTIATGDVNGDGKADVIAGSAGYGRMTVFAGNGNGTFREAAHAEGIYVEPMFLQVADVNGDGRDDVAVADIGFAITIVYNAGACNYNCGTFTAGTALIGGTTPDAVAAGDFDGDGRSDLAVANDGGVSIRRGNGDGTFVDGAQIAAGTDPDAVVVADFNRDGNADVAVASEGSNDLSVALGNGDGTFAAAVPYAAGTSPRALVAADFNRDGRIDLAVANRGSNDVSILLGNGNGTFGSATQVAAGTSPAALAAGDFDRDGKLDLAVANGGSNDVTILPGNGDGTFRTATLSGAGTAPSAIGSADFNRDGKLDLAIANRDSNDLSLLLGTGSGSFAPALPFAAGNAPAGLVTGDFNGDGFFDVAVANSGSHDVSIFSGNGGGSFAAAAVVGSGIGAAAIARADFNGDGTTELAVANGGAGSVSVLLNSCPRPDLTLTKTHSGNFMQGAAGHTYTLTVRNAGAGATKHTVTVTDTLPVGLRATAMSGNGWSCNPVTLSCTRADSLAAGASYPAITLTVTVAANAPASVTNEATVSGGGDVTIGNNRATDVTAIVAVTDLLVSLTHTGSFVQGASGRTYSSVVKNAGGLASSGTVTVAHTLPASLTATAIAGAGWNCALGSLTCTRSDALGANSSYPAITITVDVAANAPSEVVSTAAVSGGGQSNSGNDTASDPTTIWSTASCAAFGGPVAYTPSGPYPHGLTLGDFTGDGRPDMAVVSFYGHVVSVLAGRADGTFAPAVASPTGGQQGRAMAASDLNLDGKLDLVVVNAYSADMSVLLGNGNGTFAAPILYSTFGAPHSLTIGDFNSDGLPDVAVTTGYLAQVSLFIGKGGGTFHPRASVSIGGSASLTAIVSSDLNGDGALDLVAASEYGGVWRYLGHGDGSFRTGAFSAAGGASKHLATADFNRDGRVDLAVANHNDGTVSILLGAGDGSFAAPVAYRGTFGLVYVSVSDINGDGALDVLSSSPNAAAIFTFRGNGDGTFQAPTSTSVGGSTQFFVADFNGDSRPDIASIIGSINVGVLLGGCADLTVTKTHLGDFKAGANHTYTVNVRNAGNGATQGTVTLKENLPAGLTLVQMTGDGWQCVNSTTTCTRTDSRVPNTQYQPIYVQVSVARTGPASVTNSVTVSGGGDTNNANNTASDPTTIVHAADLKVTQSHVGNFTQGQSGAVYTVHVGNIGSAATSGVVTVTNNTPRDLTYTAISGSGWSCALDTRTCTRQDSLPIDGTYPPITVTVNVGLSADLFVNNTATASGGGDGFPDNNSIAEYVAVIAIPTTVAATTMSSSQINLTWKAVQYAVNYRVLRGTSADGPFALVGSPLSNSFLDASLTAGTTYYYRVQAADQSLVTAPSVVVSATTSGTAPAPVVPVLNDDIDGDNRSDVSWYTEQGQTAFWLMNGPTKTLGFLGDTFPAAMRPVGMGDFNLDKRADVLFRNPQTGENAIWFMNGQTKTVQAIPTAAPEWKVEAVADFDGNGTADLFLRNANTSATWMWLMSGAQRTSAVLLENVPLSWALPGAADFDGDGKADLFWRNTQTGENAVWLMNGAQKKLGAYTEYSPLGWFVAGVGDFDGDGRGDVFWRHPEGYNALWLMSGTTKKSGTWLEWAPPGWQAAQIGDFDGDGKADVFWRFPDGSNAMWLMDGPTKKLGTWLEFAPPAWLIVK